MRRSPSVHLNHLEDRYQHTDIDWAFADYVSAIATAGGAAVYVPFEAVCVELVNRLDGLVLTGGDDLGPEARGREGMQGRHDHARDEAELALARFAVAADVPLLGICRGMQVMNVALGGDLIDDLPREPVDHQAPSAETSARIHEVETVEGSLARALYGPRIAVNSLHHQAVASVASPLARTGICPVSGITEIVESASGLALGVQWHPEWMPTQDPCFTWLVGAARRRMVGSIGRV